MWQGLAAAIVLVGAAVGSAPAAPPLAGAHPSARRFSVPQAAEPAVKSAAQVRAPDPPPGIFGFDVGEERRYTLDPPEVLKPGELVQYLIRLESVEGSGEDLRAKFFLENESLRFRYRSNFINPDERLRLTTRIEVTLNRHGFPLEIDYRREREEPDYPFVEHDVHISFDGDRYDYTNRGRMGMKRRVRLPGTTMVDRSVPRGVFLSPNINPGLLSVIFTTLHDPGTDDLEYMEMRAPWASFRYREYRIDSLVTVDVGGVPHDALFLRDGPQGDQWITPDGIVLKVEVRERDENAWLRLMHPWEY
jgi:hypothetical protein